jgi:putative spermidine/putrescine transport system substrate-binding protein
MMQRRTFLKMVPALSTMSIAGTGARSALAQSGSLTLMTWGGLWGNGLAENVDAPFQKSSGWRIVQDRSSSPVERVTKMKLALSNQIYDLVQVHDGVVPMAEAQGVLETLSENSPNLPFLKDIPARFKSQDWAANIYSALGIVYNTEKVKNPPRRYSDLWSNEYRGRIVLPEITHSIGPYIIPIGAMAAGRPPTDEQAGFDMLTKMARLDPIWANDTDTMMSTLQSGEAVVGLLYRSQTYTIMDKGAKVQWVFPAEGAITYTAGTGIGKNTKHKALAEQYVNMTLNPQYQVWVAKVFNYAPTNPNALALLPPDLRARVQFTPEQAKRIIDLDQKTIAANRSRWTDQWNRVVAG